MISNGSVRVPAGGSLGAATIETANGRLANVPGEQVTIPNPVIANLGGIDVLGTDGVIELTGTVTRQSNISKWGEGTLRLSGAAANTVSLHVRGGTVVCAKDAGVPAFNAIIGRDGEDERESLAVKCPAQSVAQPWRVSLPGCTAPRGRLLHPGAGKSGQCRERPLTPWAAADPGMRARLSVHLSEGPGQRRLQAVGVAAGPLGQLVLRPRCWPEVVEPQRRLTAQPSSVPVLTRGRGRLRLQATPCGRPALSLQVRLQLQPRPLGSESGHDITQWGMQCLWVIGLQSQGLGVFHVRRILPKTRRGGVVL